MKSFFSKFQNEISLVWKIFLVDLLHPVENSSEIKRIEKYWMKVNMLIR